MSLTSLVNKPANVSTIPMDLKEAGNKVVLGKFYDQRRPVSHDG
jgi:hypothetical protein